MVDLAALHKLNSERWTNARITKPVAFGAVAKRLVAGKPRYLTVQKLTGVPWYVIAVIHEREASQNWQTQLGQGDPLNEVSVHVPRGRGPFPSWEQGAVDALVNCGPYAARNKDWSPGGMLNTLELYNGLGYAARNLPSPYVWAGTDQYRSGKYVRDGVYDPNVVDTQLGCAGLLKAMMAIDATIQIDASSISPPPVVHKPPDSAKPTPIPPQPAGFWASIISALLAIFRGKK